MNSEDCRPLRPLARGYEREPRAERQIAELAAMSEVAFWRTIEDPSGTEESCSAEAMVYWIRAFAAESRQSDQWRVAEALMQRITKTILAKLNRLVSLNRDDKQELFQELAGEIYQQWSEVKDAAAFWEVRFYSCLDRRVIDVTRRRTRRASVEIEVGFDDGDDDDTATVEERYADTKAPDLADLTAARAAFLSLEGVLRDVFYLKFVEQWTEDAIGATIGKSSRTVRNYVARAQQQLSQWRDEVCV